MHLVHLVSVWIHILAATAWIGGMFFLVLVVVPWMRKGGRAQAAVFLRETGVRFRNVAWACFAILFVTGLVNLWARGMTEADLVRPGFLGSSYGKLVVLKVLTFVVVLPVSAVHDFVVGPAAVRAIAENPTGPEADRRRRQASRLGRVNALLALVLVALGVMIVRGAP